MSEQPLNTDHSGSDVLVQLESPSGSVIGGTLERITARGEILGFRSTPGGTLHPEFTGRTEVFWDEQRTEHTPAGELLVIESEGQTWPISVCRSSDGGA